MDDHGSGLKTALRRFAETEGRDDLQEVRDQRAAGTSGCGWVARGSPGTIELGIDGLDPIPSPRCSSRIGRGSFSPF